MRDPLAWQNLAGAVAGVVLAVLGSFALSRTNRIARAVRLPAQAMLFVLGVVALAETVAEIVALRWWTVPVLTTQANIREYRPGQFALAPNEHWTWGTANPGWAHFDVRTNEDGLRSAVGHATAGADERRVMLVGDSFVFGLGIDIPDTIGAQLEHLLAARSPSPPWVVINAGNPGYNFFSDVARFAYLVDLYRPREAVFILQGDDMVPDLNDTLVTTRMTRTSGLARFALARMLKAGGSYARYRSQITLDPSANLTLRPDLMPAATVRIADAARTLRRLEQTSGCKVIVFLFYLPRADDIKPIVVANLGWSPLLDAGLDVQFLPWERNLPGNTIPRDGHPTQEGARRVAELLADPVAQAFPAARATP